MKVEQTIVLYWEISSSSSFDFLRVILTSVFLNTLIIK